MMAHTNIVGGVAGGKYSTHAVVVRPLTSTGWNGALLVMLHNYGIVLASTDKSSQRLPPDAKILKRQFMRPLLVSLQA